jgi:hypothetical protein
VLAELLSWENQSLLNGALLEIVDVHHRYRNFSAMSATAACLVIDQVFGTV